MNNNCNNNNNYNNKKQLNINNDTKTDTTPHRVVGPHALGRTFLPRSFHEMRPQVLQPSLHIQTLETLRFKDKSG